MLWNKHFFVSPLWKDIVLILLQFSLSSCPSTFRIYYSEYTYTAEHHDIKESTDWVLWVQKVFALGEALWHYWEGWKKKDVETVFHIKNRWYCISDYIVCKKKLVVLFTAISAAENLLVSGNQIWSKELNQAFHKIWLLKPIFYKSINLPLQTQESECLFLPCWTKRKMLENTIKWEPVAGFCVGQWVQHLQHAAAPLPHTSPFSCERLLTTARTTEGSEQSTVAERGCVETFRWRTGRQLLLNGQQRAGGGSLMRSSSENCRLESQQMLHRGKHHLTLSRLIVRDCLKTLENTHSSQNKWEIQKETYAILTIFLTTVLSKSFNWKCVQSELCGVSKHKQSPTPS